MLGCASSFWPMPGKIEIPQARPGDYRYPAPLLPDPN
jgi:hypothetical protein